MNDPSVPLVAKRRWPWLLVGVLLGMAIVPTLDLVSPSRPERYVLTQDVDATAAYFFRESGKPSPVRGTLTAGTEFAVEMKKGPAWYITLHTVVDGTEMAALCDSLGRQSVRLPNSPKSSADGWLSNYCVNATVRPVTPLAVASVAPSRPARYASR